MFRAKQKFRLSRGVAAAAVDRICRVDFSVTLRDRELKCWTQLWFGHAIFEIIRKLGFRVFMCSNIRHISVIVKK
jgi:hypothetical protein